MQRLVQSLGLLTLVALGLGTVVLGAVSAVLLLEPQPLSDRLIIACGLLVTLGLAIGAGWLIRRNRTDDRFHSGLLLAVAATVAYGTTMFGILSGFVGPA